MFCFGGFSRKILVLQLYMDGSFTASLVLRRYVHVDSSRTRCLEGFKSGDCDAQSTIKSCSQRGGKDTSSFSIDFALCESVTLWLLSTNKNLKHAYKLLYVCMHCQQGNEARTKFSQAAKLKRNESKEKQWNVFLTTWFAEYDPLHSVSIGWNVGCL